MLDIRKLKQEALATCAARRHKMGRFTTLIKKGGRPRTAEATCKLCGLNVHVDADPAPNGISIAGHAVAMNCK